MAEKSTTPATPVAAPVVENLGRERKKLRRDDLILPDECLGFEVHFEPPNKEVEVDIIAVHGIGADPRSTWDHPESKVNWLKDPTMLPAKLPHARIMSFGYNSVWFGDGATSQTLDSVATSLLLTLEALRENCRHRPIIFIGHCFGGLVIQQAYLLAVMHDRDHPGVASSVIGIVFLGTPHHGVDGNAGLTAQGEIYSAIVQANLQIRDNVLHTMAVKNDLLVATVKNFTRKVALLDPQPALFCFYESQPTKVGLTVGIDTGPVFVVDESSGTLDGHRSQSLPLNHFHMNKFKGSDSSSYKNVSFQIAKMVKRTAEIELSESTPRLIEYGNDKGFEFTSRNVHYERT